jgi:hypothetical protein
VGRNEVDNIGCDGEKRGSGMKRDMTVMLMKEQVDVNGAQIFMSTGDRLRPYGPQRDIRRSADRRDKRAN